MAISPVVTDTAPSTSARPRSAGGRPGTMVRTSATSTTPMGTLTRNTHSQPGPVVRAPLTITPIDAAVPDTAAKTPSALVRAGPSANVVVTIDRAAGDAKAAPRPCTAREA